MLKKVKVKTTHLRVSRTHTISGFSPLACKDLKFLRQSWQYPEEPKQVSVANYYWEVYKHRLKYPNAPALDVGRKGKPIYIPLELCKIVEGQWYTKPLSQIQHEKQIDFGRQSPQDRRAVCENELFQEFGLSFNPQLAKVSARLLEPPSVHNFLTSNCSLAFPSRPGSSNIFTLRVSDPKAVEKEPQKNQCFPPDERVRRMFHFLAHHRPMFILAVLPDKDSEIYGLFTPYITFLCVKHAELWSVSMVTAVLNPTNTTLMLCVIPEVVGNLVNVPFKKMCEVTIGVASQCMVKPRQLNDQYLGNLALKINLKLGGYNSPLSLEMADFLGTSTIIFGMDVSHPGSLGDVDSPSIAAVIFQFLHYSFGYTQSCIQIFSFSSVLNDNWDCRDLLIEFYNRCSGPENLRKPQQVIIYRSTDVFPEMTTVCKEKGFIQQACEALDFGYHPKITFIVAQKRQHTRFFPVPNSHYMRNGNVLPGTIIDKDVCHPSNYDFFLCSHAGLFGTTRPTHYHVLYNENDKFTPDHLQQLTNHLCYASMYLKFHIGQLILLAAVHYLLVLNLLLKFWNC
ncbi:unnamed protein product [Sphagnum jensenii]